MVVVKISENEAGLGSEYPHCDQIQPHNGNLVFSGVGRRFFEFLYLWVLNGLSRSVIPSCTLTSSNSFTEFWLISNSEVTQGSFR